MKKQPIDGYVNTDDPMHEALSKMTVAQHLQMARNATSKTISSPAQSEVETEADGPRAGALRLLKARHQSQAMLGRIPASLKLPSDTPASTAAPPADGASAPE